MTQIRIAGQQPLTRYMHAVAQIAQGVPAGDLTERAKAASDAGTESFMVATAAALENRVLQGESVELVYKPNALYATSAEFREASRAILRDAGSRYFQFYGCEHGMMDVHREDKKHD